MEDPKGIVYAGRDNTGGAIVLEGGVDISRYWETQRGAQKKDTGPDQVLRDVNTALYQAWDQDLPELKTMYSELTDQLKDYELTVNADEKRKKWYAIQDKRGDLRTYINKSAKNRAVAERVAGRMASDDKWRYNDEDVAKLDEWKKTKLKDRPEFPDVNAANTQSALAKLAEITNYKPAVVEDRWTNIDGTGGAKRRVLIDEAELQQAAQAAIPLLAQNYQDALRVEQMPIFLQSNPGVVNLPFDQQKQKFDEFLSQRVGKALLPGYANNRMDMVSLKKSNQGAGGSAGGTSRANKNGLWNVKRISEDEQYFISVQPNSTSGVKTAVLEKITVTGKEFKEITGTDKAGLNGEPIVDDQQYGIDAYIEGVVLKPGEHPVLRIKPVDILTGKLKQGTVKDVKLATYNEAVLSKYGDKWEDVFWELKDAADQDWGKRKKMVERPVTGQPGKTPTTGRNTPSANTTGTGKGASQAPTPSQKSFAPAGFPPLNKPIENLTDQEFQTYKSKLSPAQKLKLIELKKKRNAGSN